MKFKKDIGSAIYFAIIVLVMMAMCSGLFSEQVVDGIRILLWLLALLLPAVAFDFKIVQPGSQQPVGNIVSLAFGFAILVDVITRFLCR